jgi:Tfp pilus assembly protein PilV
MNCCIKNAGCRVPGSPTPYVPRTTHHASRITCHALRPSAFRLPPSQTAFSLLEVMISCAILFMAVFAILALVSGVLRNARSLRRVELDAGMVAAQISNTNKLYEGSESGDFGKMYQDCSWDSDRYEVGTNGLWQVDIIVRRRGLQKPVDVMSVWLYRPESPPRR